MSFSDIIRLTGAAVTFIGAVFLLLAAVGLLRMPDIYTRIQAGTKASTLGAMMVLLGVGISHFSWLGKIIILVIFILVTNPISSHVLARASHFIGVPMSDKTVVDKLAEDRSAHNDSENGNDNGNVNGNEIGNVNDRKNENEEGEDQ